MSLTRPAQYYGPGAAMAVRPKTEIVDPSWRPPLICAPMAGEALASSPGLQLHYFPTFWFPSIKLSPARTRGVENAPTNPRNALPCFGRYDKTSRHCRKISICIWETGNDINCQPSL